MPENAPESRHHGESDRLAEPSVPASPTGAAPASGPETPAPSPAGARFLRGKIPVGACLAGTFGTWFRGFFVFTGIVLLITGPYFLATVFFPEIFAQPKVKDVSEVGPVIAKQAALGMIAMALQQFAAAAVIYGVIRRLKRQSAGLVPCVLIALRRLFPVLGVAVLSVLIPMLPVLPGGALLFVSPGLGILLMIPGGVFYVMIYVALLVAPAVVIVERRGVLASLRRSRELTRGNRWRVFAVWIVVSLAGGAVMFVAAMAISIFYMLTDPKGLEQAVQILSSFFSVLFYALLAVTTGVVFYHLRVKVEGADEDELAAVFD